MLMGDGGLMVFAFAVHAHEEPLVRPGAGKP